MATTALHSGLAASPDAKERRPPPRKLADPQPLSDPSTATMRYQSPLRYPGAKAGITKLISEIVSSAAATLGQPRLFVEPFAGGAATALRLAGLGTADRVLLADADPLVATFWTVAAEDTAWLVDRMWDEPITLERWDYWRRWSPRRQDDRELAVKCLFVNRTTFSGILHGRAGPIGGRAQTSAYPLDCRFNRVGLQKRLEYIGDLYRTNRLLDVWCKDWEATLADVAEWYPQLLPDRVIAYLDPPYLEKSAKLYGLSFDPAGGYAPAPGSAVQVRWQHAREHLRLADYLRRKARYRWILSYDYQDRLLESPLLYRARRMTPHREDKELLGAREWRISRCVVTMRYSAASTSTRSSSRELLLTTLPPSTLSIDAQRS